MPTVCMPLSLQTLFWEVTVLLTTTVLHTSVKFDMAGRQASPDKV